MLRHAAGYALAARGVDTRTLQAFMGHSFVTDGKLKIPFFGSKDPQFKTDPNVVPPEGVREKSETEVIQTGFRHNDMRDTGPNEAKASIQRVLEKFLEEDSPLRPAEMKAAPDLTDPGPVAVCAGRTDAEMGKRVGSASANNS
jgi:hypothetical protein